MAIRRRHTHEKELACMLAFAKQSFNKRAQRANVCGRWTAIVLMLAANSLNLKQGRVLARRTSVDQSKNMVRLARALTFSV